jgi:hypothetical protein
VPETRNLDDLFLLLHPVNDPVRAMDDLADIRLIKLGHNTPQFWKGISVWVLAMSSRPKLSARTGLSKEM